MNHQCPPPTTFRHGDGSTIGLLFTVLPPLGGQDDSLSHPEIVPSQMHVLNGGCMQGPPSGIMGADAMSLHKGFQQG